MVLGTLHGHTHEKPLVHSCASHSAMDNSDWGLTSAQKCSLTRWILLLLERIPAGPLGSKCGFASCKLFGKVDLLQWLHARDEAQIRNGKMARVSENAMKVGPFYMVAPKDCTILQNSVPDLNFWRMSCRAGYFRAITAIGFFVE